MIKTSVAMAGQMATKDSCRMEFFYKFPKDGDKCKEEVYKKYRPDRN